MNHYHDYDSSRLLPSNARGRWAKNSIDFGKTALSSHCRHCQRGGENGSEHENDGKVGEMIGLTDAMRAAVIGRAYIMRRRHHVTGDGATLPVNRRRTACHGNPSARRHDCIPFGVIPPIVPVQMASKLKKRENVPYWLGGCGSSSES
ncbi:hypothetical protein NL676_002587 [Syzygium grande]|nr:hypothetical protein NL676_002587 [Syzygium grande]